MDVTEAQQIEQRVWFALAPDSPTLTLSQLQEHHSSLCKARQARLRCAFTTGGADDLLQRLRQEIEAKRAEERGERHHEQAMSQGSNILFWTKCAVVAAVVVPIFVALIAEIPFSKLLHAITSKASPTSSPQAIATAVPLESPTATKSPSESPPASPTPELTSMPTMTPIKFPPPAP